MNLYEIKKDHYINVNNIISISAMGKITIIEYGIGQDVIQQTINKNFDDVYNEIIEIGCIYDQSIIGINHELEEIKKLILAFYKYNTKRF